jgi:NADH-quinone oxidoreductase subunit N
MWTDFLMLMKQEMMLIVIIFILMFLKLGKDRSNESYMSIVNILLLVNLLAGFIWPTEGVLFNEMFRTNKLMILEKNILNLGILIISLQSSSWLKTHKHVPEFYILLLSTMVGMFFMISAGNLLMFYLGLELSTIPLAAAANFDLAKRRSSEAAMKLIFSSALSYSLSISYSYT